MSIYAIGDLQGCYDDLLRLLDKIHFDPLKDTLWLTGDLVNRGPKSLATLRYVQSLGEVAITVLGNHDLHLLAVHAGLKSISTKSDLYEILKAPDCDELMDWLRRRPLLYIDNAIKYTLVHAGIFPQWDLETSTKLAREAEYYLQSNDYQSLLKNMYGDTRGEWSNDLTGWPRLRFIINAFTRMRYCDASGRMNLSEKGLPGTQGKGLLPWFTVKDRQSLDTTVVFGHWSALGLVNSSAVLGLDTGCVWGGVLTAARLDSESLEIYSTKCDEYRAIKN